MCKHLYGGPACVLIRPAVSSARYWNAYIIDVFHFHVVRLTLSAGEEKRKQNLITTVRRTRRSTKRSTSTKHFCCSHSPDLSNRSTRDRCSHRSRLWATMNCASMEGATVHAYLRTIQGPLRLEGKGFWANGDHPGPSRISRHGTHSRPAPAATRAATAPDRRGTRRRQLRTAAEL
jgi:hypothetical protein